MQTIFKKFSNKRNKTVEGFLKNNSRQENWRGLFLFLLFYPLFLGFCVELVQRINLNDIFDWLSYGLLRFYIGYLVILLTLLFLYAISMRLWFSTFLTTTFFVLMSFINYFKINYRGEPFMPWDLTLGKEALGILSSIEMRISFQNICVLIIIIILLISLYFSRQKLSFSVSVKGRLFLGISSLLTIGLIFSSIFLNNSNLEKLNIENLRWSQSINYKHNGFLTGFFINIKHIIIASPENYNQETLEQIFNASFIPSNTTINPKEITPSPEYPNIILIMSESFFDPTQLPNVTFSSDPMPTINQIRAEGKSGDLFVSEYGGGTANTEFEVLTGHKTMYLPSGSTPYQQYIKEETFSLPRYLKTYNYDVLAIHPHEKWFWERNVVYPRLGFDDFIGDVDIDDPKIKGNFISDETAMKEVIQNFEDYQNSSNPFFTFLITMQNHGAYEEKNYPNYDVIVNAPTLSPTNQTILQNYVQGIYDADIALNHLINYFKEVNEPTIILMFGDHLPALGNDYEIYKELGYISQGELSPNDYLNLYHTPIVLWNNYDLASQDLGLIDASLLGSTLLKETQIPLPNYWEILSQYGNYLPRQNNYIQIDEDGNIFNKTDLRDSEKELNDLHWLIEFDTLFGDQILKNSLMTH
ncbi:MAG: LTA synthase family protein [Eubacteriaceae bacterium]